MLIGVRVEVEDGRLKRVAGAAAEVVAEKPGDEFWGEKNHCVVEIVQPLVGSSFVGNTIQ